MTAFGVKTATSLHAIFGVLGIGAIIEQSQLFSDLNIFALSWR